MKILEFKTTIKCGGCIAAVKPHLDTLEGLSKWRVDVTHADKILTIETEHLTAATIQDVLKKIGYQATLLNS